MPLSPSSYKSELVPLLVDDLLGFAWRQWGQFGVSGAVSFPDRWIVDPEALLLFTLQLGRFDPRLFDEVLDWCGLFSEWLSIQRIKALLSLPPAGSDAALFSPLALSKTVAAVAAVMDKQARGQRWRTLNRQQKQTAPFAEAPLPFFRDMSGEPLPLLAGRDLHFAQNGLDRSPVVLRKLSTMPRMELPACLMLRLRALFGLDPRAESVAYLLCRQSAGEREIARVTGYNPATIHTALTRLAQGHWLGRSVRRGYALDSGRWRTFLGGDIIHPSLRWVDWVRVLPAVIFALDVLLQSDTARSPYLYASRLLRLDTALRAALTEGDLPNPFTIPCSLDNVTMRLPENLLALTRLLNRGAADE